MKPFVFPTRADAAGTKELSWKVDVLPRAQVTAGYDAEIAIYDVIGGGDIFFGGVSAESIYYQLRAVQGERVLCRINSVGGSVTEGMAIYNLLMELPGEITTRVDGLAGSIASIIMMAGTEREIAPNAYVMIHQPYAAMVDGNAQELHGIADFLDSNLAKMIDIYASRSGMKPEDVKALVDKTTYMSAEEAVRLGFCTRVTGPKARMVACWKDKDMNGAPEKLKNAIRAAAIKTTKVKAEETDEEKSKSETEELKEARAEIEELKSKLQAAKEGEIDALKAELKEAKEELAKMQGDHPEPDGDEKKMKAEGDEDEELKGKAKSKAEGDDDEEIKANARLATIVMNLTGEKNPRRLEGALMALADRVPSAASQRKDYVSQLIAQGKLLPAKKDWALTCSAESLDAYLELTGGARLAPLRTEHEADEGAGRAKNNIDPGAVVLSQDELKICAQMGFDKDKWLEEKRKQLTGAKAS